MARVRSGLRALRKRFCRRRRGCCAMRRNSGSVILLARNECAKNHRPAHLQRAQIALRKRFAGKINGRDRQLFRLGRSRRYSASSRIFSSLAGVAAIASPTSAKAQNSDSDVPHCCLRLRQQESQRPGRFPSVSSSWFSALNAHASYPRSRKSRANSAANPCSVRTRFGCTSST